MSYTPVWVRLSLNALTSSATDTYSGLPETVPWQPIYLWTVFFKIDGNTAWVDIVKGVPTLQGTAVVVGTPGDHGDLPTEPNLAAVPIPTTMGDYRTLLAPIPFLKGSSDFVAPGVVGCVGILMLQMSTPDDDVTAGHAALNSALQQQLNDLIPQLTMNSSTPTQAEVKALKGQVASAVFAGIKNALSTGNKFLYIIGDEDQDEEIGAVVWYFSGDDLGQTPPGGLSLQNGYPNQTILQFLFPESAASPSMYRTYFTFEGGVIADPFPLSLKRLLTRLNVTSLRKAMQTSSVAYSPANSMASWMNATA
jgi:hypothetical protein